MLRFGGSPSFMSLADFLGYGPAAFLYLLALAATMSGYASPSIAILLAAVGTVWLIGHWAHKWHQRRTTAGKAGVEPSHIIVVCLVGAALLLMGAAGTYIWQQFFSSTTSLLAREPSAPQSMKQIVATVPFDPASLTPVLKEEFYRAIHSVDNLGVNFSRKVSIVAEEGGAPFARALVDIFIAASWTPEDHGGSGEYVGTPNGYRLSPGVTISAPVPSGAAEAVRAAFERIGISTRRKTDRSRADDFLIVEIGPTR